MLYAGYAANLQLAIVLLLEKLKTGRIMQYDTDIYAFRAFCQFDWVWQNAIIVLLNKCIFGMLWLF